MYSYRLLNNKLWNLSKYIHKILSCSDDLSDYQIDNSTLGMFNKSTLIKINQGGISKTIFTLELFNKWTLVKLNQ